MLRWVVSLVVVAVVLGVEWAVPFRIPIQSKLEHVSTNLIIFGGNSFIAQLLAGWTFLIWSSYVTSEGGDSSCMPFDRPCRSMEQDQLVSASTAAPINLNR